jgi:hypothetical protein
MIKVQYQLYGDDTIREFVSNGTRLTITVAASELIHSKHWRNVKLIDLENNQTLDNDLMIEAAAPMMLLPLLLNQENE